MSNQEVFYSEDKKKSKWSALDPKKSHPLCPPEHKIEDTTQSAEHTNKTLQLSEEYIFIKDSCDVSVDTTDTKGAIQLQASLQTALAIVISISIADSAKAEMITQDLLQSSKIKQVTQQKTIVENSRNVKVTTTDTQIAANIQLLLQSLFAVLVQIDAL